MQKVATPPRGVSDETPPKEMPKADGLPLIGAIPALVRKPIPFLQEATQDLGDIYRVNLGLTDAVILCSPHHARHVLQTNAANYCKGGPMWDIIGKLLGNGLVVSDGDYWQRQRRMMQPEFHSRRLATLTDTMVEAIEEALDTWECDLQAGDELGLVTATNRITMRVIVKSLFGNTLTTHEFDEVSEAMSHILDYLIKGMVFGALPEALPLPGKRKFYRSIEKFDQAVYRIIEDCRKNGAAATGEIESERHTLLAMLMDAVDDETGETMTDEQLRDEVATLFVAGYETTSLVVAWALIHLQQHPDIAEKLRDEVDRVLGDRPPTFEDIPNLGFTRQVFDETLRFTPSVWMVPREAVAADVVDGYRIDPGTVVVMLNYMIHRHPDHWDDPDEFVPERFSTEASNGRDQYAYTPFGGGKRLCIGKAFAHIEGTLILAMLAQRFKVTVHADKVETELTTTLRPKGNPTFDLAQR